MNNLDAHWVPLHALTLLAQLGTFTAVAQRLGVSKAVVSQRISDLERRLGQPLVHRTTRAVRLTEAGQRLVAETAPSLAHVAQRLAMTLENADQPRGLVRLTAPVALGRQWVSPLVAEFGKAHPQIQVELVLTDRLVTLAHEGIDLAVRHVSAPPDNHVAHKLAASRSCLVASPAYLSRRPALLQPEQLVHEACLTYLRPGPAQWRFQFRDPHSDAVLNPVGVGKAPALVDVSLQPVLRANNSEVLRDAAESGLGVALLPEFSASKALSEGRLQAVLPAWEPVGFFGESIFLMRPWTPITTHSVQLLWGFLKHHWPTAGVTNGYSGNSGFA